MSFTQSAERRVLTVKYRIAGIVACLLVLCVVFSTVLLTPAEEIRYVQHRDAEEKVPCTDHGDDVFCTHLPLLMIDTNGKDIPGKRVHINHERVILTGENGEEEITASIKIIDNEKTMNHTYDEAAVDSLATIHIRGNSSRSFDKSSYAVDFITEDGENNNVEVMGMASHHEWVLHGPFLDKTLMRNYMWYNIAGQIMDYAPNVRFCEVFLNGEYNGVYVMCERITGGKNGSRLQISVNKKNNTYTGYLLCLDWQRERYDRTVNTFTKYARRRVHDLEIRYPGREKLTEELKQTITDDFSDFEKTLYSYDFDDPVHGYSSLIDVDSFADYFIINELTCNYDAGWLSTYIYKDISGKFKMCIWDFNSACDNYQEAQIMDGDFQFENCLWYVMLMKDENFNKRIISRYRELRKTYLSEEYMLKFIDDIVDYLGPAVDRNFEKWGYSFGRSSDRLIPHERNPRSYEEAVKDMKDFLVKRGNLMDREIKSILQYSATSRKKKFIENAN